MLAQEHWMLHSSSIPFPCRPLSIALASSQLRATKPIPPVLASSQLPATNSNPLISTTHFVFPRRALLHSCFVSSFISYSPPSLASDDADGSVYDTNDWYQFQGDGFSLSIPPDFEDILEPEDFTLGLSLYGERAKIRPFAARFASSDRSEVLSVVIRQASQLRLTFFATKDITDFGSLRDAASVFVPVGATLHAAQKFQQQTDAELPRTYYYYEFSTGDNYFAMEAAASSGKVFVVGATAPKLKWKNDGRKLRSAAASFSLL